MSRLSTYTLGSILALSIVGCASTPKTFPSIDSARAAIQQVESMPLAGEVAVKELDAAHEALRIAESFAEKKKPEVDINNAAYLATKHAHIAKEQIAAAEAKKAQEGAQAERLAVVAGAREQEAKIKAEEAARKAAADKERIALLEKELSDLNAKKTDRGLVLTLGDVLFDTAQATLKPGAVPVIDRLATFLKDSGDRGVQIEGHTDSVGADDYNQELSQRRAEAVRQALLSRGVPTNLISATGKGETFPIASNDSAGGRQQNRRVEIVIENPTPERGASR